MALPFCDALNERMRDAGYALIQDGGTSLLAWLVVLYAEKSCNNAKAIGTLAMSVTHFKILDGRVGNNVVECRLARSRVVQLRRST